VNERSEYELLEKTINAIGDLEKGAMEAARKRQDALTKPQGSLGRLEELSIQVAGITEIRVLC
jgi:nicotinate-nucleotide--dimethylbenzimidazole phosphoribosyltransferase